MSDIYIDADACPVKEHTFRVAKRYGLKVFVVSNSSIVVPAAEWIEAVVVGSAFDAVDDWIEGKVTEDDIVITNDLLLTARCLKKGARVMNPRGKVYTDENIGDALSTRELMSELRQRGVLDLGPTKMGKNHRSSFLSALDQEINAAMKKKRERR